MYKVNRKALVVLIILAVVCVGVAIFLVGRKDVPSQETISGTVTSKFTDCVGGQEMDRNGNIAPIKNVSCDGGSTITIDYKDTFITTTGLVASGGYSVDVSSIKVGDKVKVQYIKDDEGYKNLSCPSCGVTKD